MQTAMQTAMQEAGQNQDRQAMQDARTTAHDKALALLTSDQKTALAAFIKAHPQQGGRGGFGGGRFAFRAQRHRE